MSTAETYPAPPERAPSTSTDRGAYRVRLVPLPAAAPRYDDESEDRPQDGLPFGHREPGAGESAGPRAVALPLPLPPPSAAVPRLRLLPAPAPAFAGPREGEGAGAEAGRPAGPDAGQWCARFVRVVLETMSGLRPVGQLGGWASPDVCRFLARRVSVAARCHPRTRSLGSVRSIHLSSPAAEVAEVCAVVQFDARVRALALRVELSGSGWRCTELQVG